MCEYIAYSELSLICYNLVLKNLEYMVDNIMDVRECLCGLTGLYWEKVGNGKV